MKASVVIPVYNGAATLGDCLRALQSQLMSKDCFEVIVVDDGSSDATSEVAESFGVRCVRQPNGGAPSARNAGIRAATGRWIAFTDADCVPSRHWLAKLLKRVEAPDGSARAFGAAGTISGHASETPAARFVDLTRGLDAERHLLHPRFPFAPSANVMYRREDLVAAGGFDERYATYDACDLHQRMRGRSSLPFIFEPGALVLHSHRPSWKAYWRQQCGYGVGYAQFFLHYNLYWGVASELRTIWSIVSSGVLALLPASSRNAAIVRKGTFIRKAAQHIGFLRTFFDRSERRRWNAASSQWSPFALGRRIVGLALRPMDVVLAARMAWFVYRLPEMLKRTDLASFLRGLSAERSGRASLERVLRVRGAILQWFRRADTCYARALTLVRFLNVEPQRIDFRLGVEPARAPGDRIRGHAWVMLDGRLLEGPEGDIVARSTGINVCVRSTG